MKCSEGLDPHPCGHHEFADPHFPTGIFPIVGVLVLPGITAGQREEHFELKPELIK